MPTIDVLKVICMHESDWRQIAGSPMHARMVTNHFRIFLEEFEDREELFKLTSGMVGWIDDNATEVAYLEYDEEYKCVEVYFLSTNDAVHFKLYWQGRDVSA